MGSSSINGKEVGIKKMLRAVSTYQKVIPHLIFEIRIYNSYKVGSPKFEFHDLSPGLEEIHIYDI